MRIFGFTIFEYPSNEFKISKAGLILCCVNLIYKIVQTFNFTTLSVMILKLPLSKDLLIIKGSILITVIISYYLVIISMIINLIMTKSMFETIKKLKDFDEEVNEY